MRTGSAADFWNGTKRTSPVVMPWDSVRFGLASNGRACSRPHHPEPRSLPNSISGFGHGDPAHRLAACRRQGLEPVVTLQHFTHPAWLGLDAWLDDGTPALFERFVSTTVRHVNRRLLDRHGQPPLHWFVTLNEPNMLVINTYSTGIFRAAAGVDGVAVTAYNRLLAAHVRAYNAIHDVFEAEAWTPPRVTMNTFCSDVYWSEKMLLDLLCARERNVKGSDLQGYLREESNRLQRALQKAELPFQTDPFVWLGRLFHFLVNVLAPRHAVAATFAYFLDAVAHSKRDRLLDYIGLDYYDPFTGHLFRPPSFVDLEFRRESLRGQLMDSLSRKWWDWHVLPEGMTSFADTTPGNISVQSSSRKTGWRFGERSTTALPTRGATS